jgi:hypothetical protein
LALVGIVGCRSSFCCFFSMGTGDWEKYVSSGGVEFDRASNTSELLLDEGS